MKIVSTLDLDIYEKYCKSLFFHKCLWNSSASAANPAAADRAGWSEIVSIHDRFI